MNMSLSFSQRCFALIGLPAFLLTFVGAWIMWDRWQAAENLADIGSLARTAPIVSALVHEMQKERGYSAGFIGSRGAQFDQQLGGQRRSTDGALSTYKETLEAQGELPFGNGFAILLRAADDALRQLDAKRSEVSAFSITVGEMAAYYTGTIGKLLDLVGFVGQFATDDELVKLTDAYQAVLLAKERAGLERAMGANGFGKGKFQPTIIRRFVDLIGQQRAFMDRFAHSATPKQRSFAAATMSGPDFDDVDRLRDIATASPFTNDLQGVTAPVWFQAITKKIDLYKALEDRLAEDLVATAIEHELAVSRDFWLVSTGLVLALALTMAIGWFLTQDAVAAIRNVVDAIGRLANGQRAEICLLYTSPSPRDKRQSRMPSSA